MDPTSRQLPHPASQKPRIRDFEANLPPPSTAIPRPSNFAINKLRELEYVELYYFTPEGLAEAVTYDHSAAHDALTFAQIDGTIVLRPSSTSNPSPNAVPDDALTWRQMTIAKTTLLRCMANTGWANNYIAALDKFYTRLEAHQTRFEPEGEASLLQYQAEVRREWHDALDPSRPGLAFDISQINEDRIARTMANILNRRQAANVLRLERELARRATSTSPTNHKSESSGSPQSSRSHSLSDDETTDDRSETSNSEPRRGRRRPSSTGYTPADDEYKSPESNTSSRATSPIYDEPIDPGAESSDSEHSSWSRSSPADHRHREAKPATPETDTSDRSLSPTDSLLYEQSTGRRRRRSPLPLTHSEIESPPRKAKRMREYSAPRSD